MFKVRESIVKIVENNGFGICSDLFMYATKAYLLLMWALDNHLGDMFCVCCGIFPCLCIIKR